VSERILVPVVDPNQPLNRKAIADLPLYLEDEDDRAGTRQLMEVAYLAALPGTTTVVSLADMFEDCDTKSLRFFRESAEKLASITEKRAERQREEAERAARVKLANNPSQLTLTPAGWKDLAEEAREALRTDAELRSRQAQREAEQERRELEAQASDEYRAAREAQRARELPAHPDENARTDR